MTESGIPLSSRAISFPAAGIEAIDAWVAKSGIPAARFYSVALTLGARVQVISLEPLVSLDASLRTEAGHSVNASVTDGLLVRLVLQASDSGLPATRDEPECWVVVSIASELLDRLDQIAQTCAIEPGKLHALSLATGVQLLSSAFSPESSVPPELLLQIADGPVAPDALLTALLGRQCGFPGTQDPP